MSNTMKKFIDRSNLPAPLIRAVIKQSGGWENFQEMARDVAEYGADKGFPGWISYSETTRFFRKNKNRKTILEYADELASYSGDDVLSLIQNFEIFRTAPIKMDDLAKALYTGKGPEVTRVYNIMAWFALEEVSIAYVNLD